MKQQEILMLVVAFLCGLFFKQIMNYVCPNVIEGNGGNVVDSNLIHQHHVNCAMFDSQFVRWGDPDGDGHCDIIAMYNTHSSAY